jgi:beta-alanine--pyruvate transaminase
MQGPEGAIEIFHGYTYSGHPVAAAAGIAAMETYEIEGIFEQSRSLEGQFEEILHSFDDHPKVKDVRNFGLMGAIEMHSREGAFGARGIEMHKKCFWEQDLVIRNGMDTLQFSPFLNSKPDEMLRSFEKIRSVMDSLD